MTYRGYEQSDERIECDHVWPPELDVDARCERCGLRYMEWSEQPPARPYPVPSDR